MSFVCRPASRCGALGIFSVRDVQGREELRQVGAVRFSSARVRDLVHAAAHEQVARQRARRRMTIS